MEDFDLIDLADVLVEHNDADKDKDTPVKEQEITEVVDVSTEEEEIEEVEDKQVEEVDPMSVKAVYNALQEYIPLDDNENPTKDWLEEQVRNLPNKVQQIMLDSIPNKFGKDVLEFALNKPELTKEDLIKYVNTFGASNTVDVSTSEGAREYLKSNASFTRLYDEGDLEEALDMLEDKDKLMATAKKLKDLEQEKLDKAQEAENKKAKEEREALQTRQADFQKQIISEIDNLGWKDARKDAVIRNLTPERINTVNAKIQQSAKAIVQLANLYDYFDLEGGNFDKLYALIEGKKDSKGAKDKLNKLEQSSGLSSLFSAPSQQSNSKDWIPDIK